jgi:hypothetical protein
MLETSLDIQLAQRFPLSRLEEEIREQEAEQAEKGHDLDRDALDCLLDLLSNLLDCLLITSRNLALPKTTILEAYELCLGLRQLLLKFVIGYLGCRGDSSACLRDGRLDIDRLVIVFIRLGIVRWGSRRRCLCVAAR